MEELKHNCGVVMVRLRKSLSYYQEKYGTWMYGLNKVYLLMEKQHNRGQEGAGLAVVKLHSKPGEEYMFRERREGSNAIADIFQSVNTMLAQYSPEQLRDGAFAASEIPFAGSCFMGHLRYSTTGKRGLTFVHPMIRRSNWRAKCLAVCGNFTLTNVANIFNRITAVGQHPRLTSDTHVLLEQIGHYLDREVERLYKIAKHEMGLKDIAVTNYIEEHIDLANVLRRTSPEWDGGFVMCGVTGSGESYALRDAKGIRPAYYYIDDEIIVLASERPVIQTVLNASAEDVKELLPGQALLVNRKGEPRFEQILEPLENKACCFERIYFSRGSDRDIYKERKELGHQLADPILKVIDYDLDHTVFSFIPNTAEVAYYGMLEGLDNYLTKQKVKQLSDGKKRTEEEIRDILSHRVRSEKVAIKDIKLRTFIAEGASRNDLAAHVYDVTYGTVKANEDNLVVIDDSIVRGTTLRQSIIQILSRLKPKKIIIVSSSPQIRYPDYYGIDMSRMSEFIAFRAAVALIQERKMTDLLERVYNKAKEVNAMASETSFVPNVVKEIYAPFSIDEINKKMVALLQPEDLDCQVELVFQSIEGLHKSIPNHPGDWYFTGDYPTPMGSQMVNQAFINYMENKESRAK